MKKLFSLLFLMFMGTIAYAQTGVEGYLSASATNPKFYTDDGVLFIKATGSQIYETLVKYPQTKSSTTYTVPDKTEIIARGAFKDNKYLRTIRIPSSVCRIGDNAFDGCENLSSIEVYESSSTNVNDVFDDADTETTEIGRYNIQGVKLQEGDDGQVQIILYSDGKSKKILTK